MLAQLLHYQNELLGALAILALIILYVIIKKRQTKPHIIEDAYDTVETYDIPEKEKIETTPIEENKEKTTVQPQSHTEEPLQEEKRIQKYSQAIKKDVPPHGKIHKEDFKIFAKKRVLLAEDNMINQKVILGLLADSEMEIVVANDGQEALDILEQDKNFMLVLMDAHMPNVDGFEATRRIRSNDQYAQLPVVALSGDTAQDDIKKMFDAGMEAHLEKPLKMEALYDILFTYSDNMPTNTQASSQHATRSTQETLLNTEEGIEICGGDSDFYKDILQEFIQDYKDSARTLQKLINEKNIEEADRLLLDIVGVSANIGAHQLHDSAQNLKLSLKNPQQLKNNFLHYHESLQTLLQTIQEYLGH